MARAAFDMLSGRETQEQAAELAALGRLLDISAITFSLSVAVCNSPALRDYCIETVRKSHPDLAVVNLPRGCVDVYGEVTTQLETTHPPALFITGIELSVSSESEDHPTLRSLNASRDLWETRFPCPVVFWVPAYVAALLPSQAPDFWRYRSHGFEFVAPSMSREQVVHEGNDNYFTISRDLDSAQKRFRIAELEQRIAESGSPPIESLGPHVLNWMQELGFLYNWIGASDKAERILNEALEICQHHDFADIQAGIFSNLGYLAGSRGDEERAETYFRRALDLYHRSNDLHGQARTLGNLGSASRVRGDLDNAGSLFRESLGIYEKIGSQAGTADMLQNIGFDEEELGNLNHAEALYRQALNLYRRAGMLAGEADTLGSLGEVEWKRGNTEIASDYFRQALALDRRVGRTAGEALALKRLGNVTFDAGELDVAERYLREALELYRQLGRSSAEATILSRLASIAWVRGDADKARQLWNESAQYYTSLGELDKALRVQHQLDELEAPEDL